MSHITAQLAILIFMSWTTNCAKFQQSPNILAKHDSRKEEILCSHDDSSLLLMLWYRQTSHSTALALIGYGYSGSDPTYEQDFSGGGLELKRNGTTAGSLVLSNLNSSNSAVYFCAASITVLQMSTAPSPKTLIKAVHMEGRCMPIFVHLNIKWHHDRIMSWMVYQLLLLCQVLGYTVGVTFDQPRSFTAQLNGEMKINCSHDDTKLDVMLWYIHKTVSNTTMELIGYIYGTLEPTYEDKFKLEKTKKRFQMKRISDVSSSLTISNLNLQDSAVYFCAAKEPTAIKLQVPPLLKPWHS
ncbi:uncharacterized protein LOC134067712 [Sardina pilchardus]|uniref:uncharacterized protein LOC134067712 n=1 Tax=Sardina pilchardus TaxID=27697 RepID=UPI002E130F59